MYIVFQIILSFRNENRKQIPINICELIILRFIEKEMKILLNYKEIKLQKILTGILLSTSDRSCSKGSSSLTSNGHVIDSSWTLVHDSKKKLI